MTALDRAAGLRARRLAASARRTGRARGCRPLALLDGMALVAATACGLALSRSLSAHPAFRLPRPIAQELSLLATWTLTLLALRLRGPRPGFRRLMRQPGMVASSVVVALTLPA